jgi:hypothetical protein
MFCTRAIHCTQSSFVARAFFRLFGPGFTIAFLQALRLTGAFRWSVMESAGLVGLIMTARTTGVHVCKIDMEKQARTALGQILFSFILVLL